MRQKADLLVLDGILVCMDEGRLLLPKGGLAVRDGLILELGAREELSAKYEADQTLDAAGCIVMPGLVDTHVHLATVMFRGLAEDMPLGPWLRKVWASEASLVNPRTVASASRLAILELLLGGCTCAVDMYWHPEVSAREALRAGFRLVGGPVFIEGKELPDRLSLGQRESLARDFVAEFPAGGLVEPMLMPHGTCTDSPELLLRVKRLADELGLRLNLHCAETLAERREVLSRWGKTPVRLLSDLGYLDGRSLLAHCVHVDEEEIALLAGRAAVAHNPMSNLKLASGFAPLAAMAKAGVRLGLGTDGAQSGNDLDMWLALRLAPALQKCLNADASLFGAEDAVAMATIEAAKALGLGDRIGSLEAGKRADFILVGLDAPHLVPLHDVYAQLVYAVGREDVRSVVVDGKVLVRDRVPLTIDAAATLEELRALAAPRA